MAICWERAVLLALPCFTLCRLNCFCSFPVCCLGQDVEFNCIGPVHCIFICWPVLQHAQHVVSLLKLLRVVWGLFYGYLDFSPASN